MEILAALTAGIIVLFKLVFWDQKKRFTAIYKWIFLSCVTLYVPLRH